MSEVKTVATEQAYGDINRKVISRAYLELIRAGIYFFDSGNPVMFG